ncbi:hypothetical protein OHD16_06970 [Sphingobacterium sp. ML3W]|uniref:hypothetical protein n=1 Tax=Sphingobacterium sp. ML3W TaxID=1538644 RepID=UPI00249BBFCA|nr:hypothetical protein [Sphingobacterium sp. ML3W]WFA79711.1 hypothetical protein OGI71_00110 [Sphingobacterium sp. ML3W]
MNIFKLFLISSLFILLGSCSKEDKISNTNTVEVKYWISVNQTKDTWLGYLKIGDNEFTEIPYNSSMNYGIPDKGKVGDKISLYLKSDPRFMNQNKMYVTIGDSYMKKEVKGKQGESEIKLEYTITQEDLEYYRWYIGNK